jgi:CBS-domain-containing membrane protein
VLTGHRRVAARMWAAVIALIVTVLVCLLLKASHPPAGATTLLVAIGSIQTAADAINVAVGVVIIAAVGELVRRMRLKLAAPRSV